LQKQNNNNKPVGLECNRKVGFHEAAWNSLLNLHVCAFYKAASPKSLSKYFVSGAVLSFLN
jgi:hypothetical protein